jgi:hypothetical protein
VSSKSSLSEKTHEATRERTTREEERYSRNSKTTLSSRQLHRDFREYCAMSRKYKFDRLSTKANFINRRLWAIDEARHRWKCLWCFDSILQTFSLRHHDRSSLSRQEKEARRRLESYSLEERAELELWDGWYATTIVVSLVRESYPIGVASSHIDCFVPRIIILVR